MTEENLHQEEPVIRRPLRLAAALAAVAALLAGCQAPGTAATVNGERITDREVSQVVADWREWVNPQYSNLQAVGSLVLARVVEPVAGDHGMAISDQQVVTLLNEDRDRFGMEPVEESDLSPAFLDALRSELWFSGLQSGQAAPEFGEAVNTALTDVDVEINPRYGVQGTEGELFMPDTPEWIATSSAR